MKTLEEELKDLGYSDELVKKIAATPKMTCQNIDVDMAEYWTYDNIIVSTNNVFANSEDAKQKNNIIYNPNKSW